MASMQDHRAKLDDLLLDLGNPNETENIERIILLDNCRVYNDALRQFMKAYEDPAGKGMIAGWNEFNQLAELMRGRSSAASLDEMKTIASKIDQALIFIREECPDFSEKIASDYMASRKNPLNYDLDDHVSNARTNLQKLNTSKPPIGANL